MSVRHNKFPVETILSVDVEDLKKCSGVCFEKFGTCVVTYYHDGSFMKFSVWIWLFRLYRKAIEVGATEDSLINNIILNIEHEWLEGLIARNISCALWSHHELVHSIIYSLQRVILDRKRKCLWKIN